MNVLAIGAHFDDIELGCGGALARHVAHGDSVHAYVATVSGFMNAENQEVRANEVAIEEGQAAMAILGVSLTCGYFRTLEVEFNESLIDPQCRRCGRGSWSPSARIHILGGSVMLQRRH